MVKKAGNRRMHDHADQRGSYIYATEGVGGCKFHMLPQGLLVPSVSCAMSLAGKVTILPSQEFHSSKRATVSSSCWCLLHSNSQWRTTSPRAKSDTARH